MEDQFIKKVYDKVKTQFSGSSRKSWIWVDYFESEEGFVYFANTLKDDDDLVTMAGDDDSEEMAEDMASEITSKLKTSNFFHEAQQSMRPY